MARGKTAALFELPLVGAAILTNADPVQIASLKKSSAALGLAFQIQDDVLDLWGKKGRNQVGSDIAEGKLSYLVVQANELLMKQKRFADAEKIKKILIKDRSETSQEEIRLVIDLLEDCGAKKAAIERFDRLLTEAALPGDLGRAVEVIAEELKSLLPR
jgi:geranylgeranyl pyrophosphate synthase